MQWHNIGALADALVEREVLDFDEALAVLNREHPVRLRIGLDVASGLVSRFNPTAHSRRRPASYPPLTRPADAVSMGPASSRTLAEEGRWRAAGGFPGPRAVSVPLLVSATYGDLCRS